MPGTSELSTVEWHSAHSMPTELRLPLLSKKPLTPTTALSFRSASVTAGSFRLTLPARMACCSDLGNAFTSTFRPSASACFGLRPGPMPPFAAPAIVLFRPRTPPQNASSPNVAKRKVRCPFMISPALAPLAWFWLTTLLPSRALAWGALTTAVSVIATSAPAALNASAIAHLLCRRRVSADRHLDVLRPPASVRERDEGAMPLPASFYRLKKLSLEACSAGSGDVNALARLASVLEQMPEHDVADSEVGGVERHEQAQPPADPRGAAVREVFRRLGRRDDHRADQREHQDRQRGLPSTAAHREQAEEAAHRAQPGDAQRGGEQKQRRRGTDGQSEQHDHDAGRHDQEQYQLHERRGRLAQVHRALVGRR